jgi:hypothetical protein
MEATIALQARLLNSVVSDIANIALGIEDEGDRAYFGSTNDADLLRELDDKVSTWRLEREAFPDTGRDLYAELAALRIETSDALTAKDAENARLREGLEEAGREGFDQGIIVAASILLNCWGSTTEATEILVAAGITEQRARELDLAEYDAKVVLPLLAARSLLGTGEDGK